ncbi:MAG: replicative DNA helicase [Natronospirillum sp.]|uniref:replicative DNA helicase n=1 Tax=Natronospirillum sp. TaxID=2812955 RepID=UPI0025FFBA97|nr:replicative DNA helicase [Natronospirillum sp.]MCH8550718.1 replicative DNA helicase [Natronospirillum sp.]
MTEDLLLKTPPHSLEAEQSLLGALMLDNSRWDTVAEKVQADDFYRPEHRAIYQTMARQVEVQQPIDVITLTEALEQSGDLEIAGDVIYLTELVENASGVGHLEAYASIVRERALLRRLIEVAGRIQSSAYEPEGRSAEELVDEAERAVFSIAEDRPSEGGPQDLKSILKRTLQRIDELSGLEGNLTGLSTGFEKLDDMTSGLQRGDLVIVAARPSMGKTAFAMNLVEAGLMYSDEPVIVFSLEMPAEQLAQRMLSSLGRINQTRVRTGSLQQDDWQRLTNAVNKIHDRPLFIDDTPGISPSEMRARTRRLVREHGRPAVIMVDYLQLMSIKGFSEGRTNEISEISRSLKGMAKEFDCPVVALSQLNRSLEQRPNKRPVNSDLRESGAIEQDADIIAFIYRDVVYNPDTPDQNVSEIIIGKQRNGPIGTCYLSFIGEYTRFENLSPDYQMSGSEGAE